MSYSKVRLYVRSAKVVAGTTEAEHEVFGRMILDPLSRAKIEGRRGDGTFRVRQFAVETNPKYDYLLDEDQQRVVDLVERIARRNNLEVEVVDVTSENILRRVLQERRERIKTFPTLVVGSEQRVEGEITEEQVESLFSRIA